jgi:hypothetical protein
MTATIPDAVTMIAKEMAHAIVDRVIIETRLPQMIASVRSAAGRQIATIHGTVATASAMQCRTAVAGKSHQFAFSPLQRKAAPTVPESCGGVAILAASMLTRHGVLSCKLQ